MQDDQKVTGLNCPSPHQSGHIFQCYAKMLSIVNIIQCQW